MLEYVLVLAGMLAVVGILGTFVGVTVRYAARADNLVASDYP